MTYVRDDEHLDEAPRTYLRPASFSPVGFFLRSLGLVAGAGVLAAAAYCTGQWTNVETAVVIVIFLMGGLAILCVCLPIFGWYEHRDDQRLTAKANEMMTSHSVSTAAFLQIRLDRAQEWLQAEREKDRVAIEAVTAKAVELEAKLGRYARERGPGGKWISSRPTAPPDNAVITLVTIEGTSER